jgi:hypothetical protein
MNDVIGKKDAISNGSPEFSEDRFGKPNGALRIYDKKTAWQLPIHFHFTRYSTVTMWVKKIECGAAEHIVPKS